jgi:hypothetical protein
MASLIDLSAEIICMIIDELPLSSHFELACTCRILAAACQHVLRRHQDAHRRFQVASDLDPSTVPLLLQSVFGGDALTAWHVRSFEVWRDRTTWAEWVTYSLDAPCLEDGGDDVLDMDILRFRPLLGRVGEYINWFDEQAFAEIDREKAHPQIESGHDGFLKALLFAKLPRLRDLKFVPRTADSGSTLWWLKTLLSVSEGIGFELPADQAKDPREDASDVGGEDAVEDEAVRESHEVYEGFLQESEFEDEWERAYESWTQDQVLEKMEHMDICRDEDISKQDSKLDNGRSERDETLKKAESIRPTDHAVRPDCFISLSRVAIGVVSGTWMDDEEYPCALGLIGRLLLLPNLDTLYFNGLRCNGEDHFEETDDTSSRSDSMVSILDYDCPPVGSSSVKHLFFEGLEYKLDGDVSKIIFDAPRHLLSAAFRDSGPSGDDFHNANRVVRDLATAQGSSLQSLMWYSFKEIRGDNSTLFGEGCFKKFLALKQVSFNVQDLPPWWDECPGPFEGPDEHYVRYAADTFPMGLEYVVLWGDANVRDNSYEGRVPDGLLLLERVIVEMIRRTSNLKAIFLEEVENATKYGRGSTSFEKAAATGRAKGIDVHTKCNRPALRDVGWPEPVEKSNLKTGNFSDRRAGGWGFDPYTGRRVLRN